MKLHFEQIQMQSGESLRLLRWDKNVDEVQAIFTDGRLVPLHGEGDHWHYHREVELAWISQGSGTRVIGDDVSHFTQSDLVLIGSYLPHYWHGAGIFSGMALQFDAAAAQFRQLPEFESLRSLLSRAHRGLLFTGDVKLHITHHFTEMISAGPARRFGLLMQILAEMVDAPDQDMRELSRSEFPHTEYSTYRQQMEEAVRWIFENAVSEALYVDDLLKRIGMSKSTFSRQFPRHTGRTLMEFVNEVRVNHARQQLADTGHSIAEIAFASGYQNLSHFNRMFLKQTGETPSVFRQRMRI